jgi:hypothetical protein
VRRKRSENLFSSVSQGKNTGIKLPMNSIHIKANKTGVVLILLLIFLALLFTLTPDFFLVNKRNSSDNWPNWYGLLILIIPFLLLSQFKSVSISDGKIRIFYYLTRKKITAPVELISRISFGTTKMDSGTSIHRNFYDRVIFIQFKDHKKTVIKIHGGFHSGIAEAEKYFKAVYPELCW